MVRIEDEKVSGTRSPWGLVLLEMGTLPESATYLYRKDKINGLFVYDCARLLIFRNLFFFFQHSTGST